MGEQREARSAVAGDDHYPPLGTAQHAAPRVHPTFGIDDPPIRRHRVAVPGVERRGADPRENAIFCEILIGAMIDFGQPIAGLDRDRPRLRGGDDLRGLLRPFQWPEGFAI